MALTKEKLGKYIELLEIRNSDLRYGVDEVRGVNTSKQMMPTKADLNNRDLSKFQIVEPGVFFFNHRTSRNGSKFSVTYNDTDSTIICTEDYVVFRISEYGKQYILPEWLYMFFNRPEFDRYVIANSWGSSTEFYNWEDLCDVDMELPPLPVQQKYVAIYKAMLANQQSYERGLEDLKFICDAYIDKIERSRYVKLGKYIQRNQKKNQEIRFSKADVKGINTNGYFIKPMRLFAGDIATFKIIGYNDFVYNSRINSTINRLSIALNEGEDLIVTPAYETFYIENPNLLHPFYLYMLLQRDRFARTVLFNSFGSSTVFFGFDNLSDIEIPVIDVEEQKAISNVYRLYKNRHEINERLKAQIKDLCPILVKGAVEEGEKT